MVLPLPEFRQDKLPLRVLDVDATLSSNGMFKFCSADSFSDFCVISHRWNPHVVQLMDEINKATTELKLGYPQAVTQKNWAQLPAYVSIKGFLEVLQEQGVKKVWMDTLCIDQSKDSDEDSRKNEEKSREIPLMGAYYRHSSACYVPINGFGFDFKLPLGQLVTNSLPWISRVWTLQEFLLPDKLFFFVEVEKWMEEWLSRRVATAGKDLSHFCTCCVGEFSFMLEALRIMSEEMEGVACQVEKIREVNVNLICEHCKSPPLLRKVNKEGQLYLVQREAIFAIALLAQFHDRVKSNNWVESEEEQTKRFDEAFPLIGRNEWLLRVMHVRRQGTWFNTFEIMEEVCNRKCERELDYILGVLGLMGVNANGNNQQEQLGEEKATLQLNAKTPQEQLVQLASSGAFSEQLLVDLCGLGNRSHGARSMPGMSWIPDVASGSISGFPIPRYNDKAKEFQSKASNVRVAHDGPITLTLKVLKGYVTCQDSKNLLWEAEDSKQGLSLHFRHESLVYRYIGKYEEDKADLFNYSKQFSRKEVKRFNKVNRKTDIEEEDRSFGGNDGKTELTFNEDGSFRLPFKNHPSNFHGFGMWLLYLGHFRGMATVLLCLHKAGTGNVVHKIGRLSASYMGMRGVFEGLKDPPEVVTIGGYGMYLDEVVDLHA